MFVKPAPDRNVRDPISMRLLPAEGAEVPETSFWLRRITSGDVVRGSVLANDGERVVTLISLPSLETA